MILSFIYAPAARSIRRQGMCPAPDCETFRLPPLMSKITTTTCMYLATDDDGTACLESLLLLKLELHDSSLLSNFQVYWHFNLYSYVLFIVNARDKGTCPHNILEVMSFILSSNSNNCCLLYFNANIMCSFTKKLQLLEDPQLSFMSPQ